MRFVFGSGHFILILISIVCGTFSYSAAENSKLDESGSYQMAEYHQNVFVNTIGIKFKLLRPGSFVMGAIEGAEDEMPVHLVTISRPFYMGVYEVTQAQWKQLMNNNPSEFEGDSLPVENVSWNQVQKFIQKLSEKEGVRYRLPTEAEWEYACRAGTRTRYYWGDAFKGEYAWYRGNSGGKTHPVGQKKPNAWGVYDMTGNVYEWCADGYGEYTDEHVADPEKQDGTRRIGRGGSWSSSADGCRSSNRGSNHPFRRFDVLGFRLVREQ